MRAVLAALVFAIGCASSGEVAESDEFVAYDLQAAQGGDAPKHEPMPVTVEAEGKPLSITIAGAIDEAITNNRLVMQSRLDAAIGLSNERIARSQMLPFIGTRYSFNSVNAVQKIQTGGGSFATAPEETQNIGVFAEFPIFAFGRHWYGFQAARLSRERTEANRDTTESDIAAAVTAAAFDVLEAIAGIDVALATEKSLAQQVNDSQALFDAGSVTKVAVLEASVEHDAAVREREKLQSLVPILKMRLNTLLGRHADAPIEVEDDRTQRPPIWTLAALKEQAVAQRPELRAARLATAAAERSLRSQIGAEIGEIRGRVSYDYTDNPILTPQDVLSFALTFDIPIFTSGARPARIRRARHELEIAELQVRDLEDQIRTEVANAHRTVVEAFRDIAVAERSVERSEESLRIQREKFKNGRATNRELLDTTALMTNSRIALVNSIYAYKVSLRELHRARGADPRLTPFDEEPGSPVSK